MTPEQENAKQVGQAKRAQDDLDILISTGTTAGIAALAPMRVAVRKALAMSSTPDELRHHLVDLIYRQSAQAFAKQLSRARDLANLSGRLVVMDDVGKP